MIRAVRVPPVGLEEIPTHQYFIERIDFHPATIEENPVMWWPKMENISARSEVRWKEGGTGPIISG